MTQWWYFTFGCGHFHRGKYVRLEGTCDETRDRMIALFGNGWSTQYSERQWNSTLQYGKTTAEHWGWTELVVG